MVNPHEEKCGHEKFYVRMPDYAIHLINLGERGVVHSIVIVTANIEDRVMTCILLGYAQNNTSGTYRILNILTKYIVLSHDVIRRNKTNGEYVSRK